MSQLASPESSSTIQLRGVRKIFDTGDIQTHALSDIDLEIGAGEFVAITGPSGCGKSTLLSILGLLDTSDQGTYRLNGHETSGLTVAGRADIRNREIGFIFQSFNLISDLTVEENVALPLTYRKGMTHSSRKEHVYVSLERVGMGHRLGHYPSQLSGGQQQRVAVARALVGRPSILLADEPTGNLDSSNGESVMQLLEELHRAGSTLCVVTHDTDFAHRAQRVIQMRDGRIQASA